MFVYHRNHVTLRADIDSCKPLHPFPSHRSFRRPRSRCSYSCLSVRESNLVPGYRASPRTPDEGANLVTRGIILNPRYGDPPPELPISLATFSPCTSHKPSMNSKTAMRASVWVLKRRRSSSSHSSVAKKLSHIALSRQSPTEPIEGRTPASRQRWPKASEVYWADSNGRRNIRFSLIERYWSKASAGVFHPRAFRGLELRVIATAARSSVLCALRSVPFGKYWRSKPLVFSLVPRCQGLCGSQK